MTLERNKNIEKPLVLLAFEHTCEESNDVRLPQSPQQRPKNVHATRGGSRRGPFAPKDIPRFFSEISRGSGKVPKAPEMPPQSPERTAKGRGPPWGKSEPP